MSNQKANVPSNQQINNTPNQKTNAVQPNAQQSHSLINEPPNNSSSVIKEKQDMTPEEIKEHEKRIKDVGSLSQVGNPFQEVSQQDWSSSYLSSHLW